MRAAVQSLRRGAVKRLVVAVPVGAPETCDIVAGEADELVCPDRPQPFLSVGFHYETFGQTSDSEVERLLSENRRSRKPFAASKP